MNYRSSAAAVPTAVFGVCAPRDRLKQLVTTLARSGKIGFAFLTLFLHLK
jgi:hypothetical protein